MGKVESIVSVTIGWPIAPSSTQLPLSGDSSAPPRWASAHHAEDHLVDGRQRLGQQPLHERVVPRSLGRAEQPRAEQHRYTGAAKSDV